MKAIAAMSLNRVIGCNGRLPWHFSEDLKWYRKMTRGQLTVMGRKTFEPLREIFSDREVVVISRTLKICAPNITILRDVSELDRLETDKEIWICGGSELYAATLERCSDLYLTLVKREVEGDVWFPPFEHLFDFHETIYEEPEFAIQHYLSKHFLQPCDNTLFP